MTVYSEGIPKTSRLIREFCPSRWVWGLLILTFLASLVFSPAVLFLNSDEAAYIYFGQVVQQGGVPYRDVWDHKPPVTFYLSALALMVFGESHWAIWWLRAITVFVTGLLFYRVLMDLNLSRRVAQCGAVALVLLLCHPTWMEMHTPELYALPFQLICLLTGYRMLRTSRYHWAWWAGMSAAAALLAKPTSVGVILVFIPSIGLTGRFSRVWQLRNYWIVAAAGASFVLLSLVLGMWSCGALDEMFDALITFNRYYVLDSASLSSIISSLRFARVIKEMYMPLFFLAVFGIISIRVAPDKTLSVWIALTCAADFLLTNIATRGYTHYYMTPLPAFLALAMMGLAAWEKYNWSPYLRKWSVRGVWGYVVALLFVPLAMNSFSTILDTGGNLFGPAKLFPATNYVKAHTSPGDTVLTWGTANDINFVSKRSAPSRYYYSHPLVTWGYADSKRINDFVHDLETHQPVLIVDTTINNVTWIPPLNPAFHPLWRKLGGKNDHVPDLSPIYTFVAEHCEIVIGIKKCMIYHCVY